MKKSLYPVLVLLLTLTVGLFSTSALGQSLASTQAGGSPIASPDAGESATPTNLTIMDAQSTISAQATQITQLKKRVEDLSRGDASSAVNIASPTAIAVSDTDYALGETITGGDFDFTVTSAKLASSLDLSYEQLTARGVYVVVYMTVENTSNDPFVFPYSELRIKTGDNRHYGIDSDGTIGVAIGWFNGSMYDQLQPGLVYETAVVFDVSADATGLTLTTSNDFFTVDLGL